MFSEASVILFMGEGGLPLRGLGGVGSRRCLPAY